MMMITLRATSNQNRADFCIEKRKHKVRKQTTASLSRVDADDQSVSEEELTNWTGSKNARSRLVPPSTNTSVADKVQGRGMSKKMTASAVRRGT